MINRGVSSVLEQNHYDAVVALSPSNVFYLSGADIITQILIPERLAIVLWPAHVEPSLIICTIEESLVRSQSQIRDIRCYEEFKESPMRVLADAVKERGLQCGRIGIEKRYIHAEYYEELCRYLPETRFEACDKQLDHIRSIKTPKEIQLLRTAAAATDKAIAEGFEKARPGHNEADVAGFMRKALLDNGADEIAFLCLGAGPHSTESHHHACTYRLERGDIIRVDIGGTFRRYYSDLARTAVVGKATANQINTYNIVWNVMGEIIAAIRPGVSAKTLHAVYKRRFQELGLPSRMPHVGHSLGIKLHEQPMLTPYEEYILEPNMVLEIELVHVDGESLYHNEDQVVVTATGHDIVSRTRDWSQLFQIG